MNILNIETIPFYENIEAFCESGENISKGLYFLIKNPLHNNYILQNKQKTEKDSVYEITFKNKLDKENLDNQFSRGSSHICYVKNRYENKILFDVYCFSGETRTLDEEMSILIDEEQGKKVGKDYKTIADNCSITINDERYFIVQGIAKNQDNKDDEVDEKDDENKKHVPFGAFSILCENENKLHGINVKFVKTSSYDKEYLQVTNVITIRNKNPQVNYCLFKGNLKFSDKKKELSDINQKIFKERFDVSATYLEAWRNYTKSRGNKILDMAREFNKQDFNKVHKEANSFVINVKIRNLIEKLKIDEVVVYKANAPLPIFLEDKNCDFLEYCKIKYDKIKKTRNNNEGEKKKSKEEKDDKGIRCEIKSVSDNELELEPVEDKLKNWCPKDNGYIVMSMAGEETQVNRQEEAWMKITEGRAGITNLNNILEANFNIVPNLTHQKEYKISPRVRRKVFENAPTPKQIEAIKIALTTPDIALIQGPPGTGKTTVITAILEVLNEAQDKRGVCAGRVLATSYQHDAVENMIEKIRINSIPTYKYGKRRNKESYTEHIDQWCKEVETKALENNKELKLSDEEENFYFLLDEYTEFPTEENKKNLLNYICCSSLAVSGNLVTKANNLMLKDNKKNETNNKDILRKAYSLRTTENSFKDDGKKRIEELYYLLSDISYFDEKKDNKKIEQLFLNIINSKDLVSEELIKVSKNIREYIISDEQFNNKPYYVKDKRDDSVIELCDEIIKDLGKDKSKANKKDLIISEWIKNLRAGSAAFVSAIKDCDFVYSATTQQTEGKDIREQKELIETEETDYSIGYDTVIIDEAARATPPDLLIPMCKAFKRIILVGDHRQLPQLVDDDICEGAIKLTKVKSKEDEFDFEQIYKLSLFEKLFNELKELENKDKIKRIITLDAQYRTHPLLGEFASKEFYEIHPGEGYSSPRPAEDFEHNLPGIKNKAAIWIDVKGEETKTYPSYIRESEANAIIKKLSEFVKSQENLQPDKRFSYGIITFYKAQEILIKNKIKSKRDIFKCFKIQVGTVDSFQGKQFDVVFLSVVRTNKKNEYGFLKSVNRMCVSMTRQKKALIVVGDKDFITTDIARKTDSIKSLANFYDLCKTSKYGVVL